MCVHDGDAEGNRAQERVMIIDPTEAALREDIGGAPDDRHYENGDQLFVLLVLPILRRPSFLNPVDSATRGEFTGYAKPTSARFLASSTVRPTVPSMKAVYE